MSLWPLALYALLVALLSAIMLGLSYVLGEARRDRHTAEPYESGMTPTGDARARISIQFFLIAIFFVIFDVEIVFLLTWAAGARELGAPGFAAAAAFAAVLLVALYYEHREGALEWGTTAALRARGRGGREPSSRSSQGDS